MENSTRNAAAALGLLLCLSLLASCGSPRGTTTAATTTTGSATTLTGSVGDGPVIGATITVTDANGAAVNVGAITSSATGKYTISSIPAGTAYPLTVTATGGADQALVAAGVANTAPSAPLRSVVLSGNTVANISPFSTLVLATAIELGGITTANLSTAQANVKAALGMGLGDITKDLLLTDPSTFTAAELAIILKANEAIGELINRATKVNAASLPVDSVISQLGKDLTDGVLNGQNSAGTATDAGVYTDALAIRSAILGDLDNAAPTIRVGATNIAGTTGATTITTTHLSTAATAVGNTISAASLNTAAATTIASLNTTATAAKVASISLAAATTSGLTADGTSTYTVTAQVKDAAGNAMADVLVAFSATGTGQAVLSAATVATGTTGIATVTVSDTSSANDTVTVSASSGGVSSTSSVSLAFTGNATGGGTGANSMVIGAVTSVPANGSTTASVTVTLTDAGAAAVAGSPVTLTTTGAAIITSTNPTNTNTSGQATFTLIDSTPETVSLSASGGGATATGSATFTSVVDSVTVSSVTPVSASAPASGLDTIQVTFLVKNLGVAVANQVISFAGVGNLAGTPTVSPASTTTNASGLATVTVSDSKAETVTLTATAAGVAGTQALTYTPQPPATIILSATSPDPATIGITGAGAQESATLTFQVVDTNNNPVQGSHLVDFSIVAGGLNGGETLTTSQSSTINALVSTVINSGTKAGTVQVRASLNNDPTIFADASVTVTGGLPSGEAFQLASSPLNIAGRLALGLTQTITAFVSDFFSNPVAANTQAQFQTDFANITGAATFVAGTGSSAATATVSSAAPQPVDGLVTVEGQTIGGIHAKVLSLAVHPTDSNIIYAGTDGGGVFKTINAGVSWSHVGIPFQNLGAGKFANLTGSIVRDLVLDPNNARVIYAATEKGLFISTNAGESWNSLTGIRRITADNMATAAVTGVYLANGLWSDDGVTATTFAFNFQNAGTRARTTIYVNNTPATSYQLTTGGIQFIGAPASTALRGAVISADYDTNSSIGNVPFYAVAVDSLTYSATVGYSTTLYVGTYGDGVWKTVDGGKNWSRASTMATGGGGSFGTNVLSLAIDTTMAPNTVLYAGSDGNGLYKTIDAASTWTKVNGTQAAPLNESVVQDVLFNGANAWVAGKNGVHYSADSGATWNTPTTNVNATDAANTDVRGLARDATDGTLYAITYGDVLNNATPHGGVYSSTAASNGAVWSKLTDVLSAAGAHKLDAIAVFGQAGNDIVVVGSEGRSISRSADSGATWTKIIGTAPSNLTNTIFTTMNVMHSGSTTVSIIPQTSTYQPMNDGTTGGFGSFGSIYNGGTHSFYVRISDDLGNPLTPGTTFTITASAGTLTGTTSGTLGDAVYGSTDYLVSWANDLSTATQDVAASLSVTVTSGNNNASLSLGRTLIKQVTGTAISVIGTGGTCVGGTITGSGGSTAGSYSFRAGSGKVGATCTGASTATGASATFYWTLPTPTVSGGNTTPGTATDTVTITDTVTGKSATVTVTLTGN